MKVLATYSKLEEAHLVASLLEGNGIRANVRDANIVNLHWLYSNAVGGVKLEVADEDLPKALEILNLPKHDEGMLTCPNCGSSDVKLRQLNIFTAISIALGVLIPFASKSVDCLNCGKSFPLQLNRKSRPALDKPK